MPGRGRDHRARWRSAVCWFTAQQLASYVGSRMVGNGLFGPYLKKSISIPEGSGVVLDDTLRPLPAGLRIAVKLETPVSTETSSGRGVDAGHCPQRRGHTEEHVGAPGTVTLFTRERLLSIIFRSGGAFLKGDKLQLPRDFGTVCKTRPWQP